MAFVKYHLPCPKCGGSDPVSVNENGSAKCFSCNTFFKDYESSMKGENVKEFKTYKTNSMNDVEGDFLDLTDRNISVNTAKKYGVKALKNSAGDIVRHYYPYYNINEISGYKVREPGKIFSWKGDSQSSGLFGQQAFQDGGKYITITEGECDAMATFELMGSKWPAVSLKNGASGAVKDIKKNIEYLESFDTVVIAFDNDVPGKEAAKKAAKLLTPGKAKIINLPADFKDPNEMLRKGQHEAFMTAWWSSKVYTPSGVINVSDNIDRLSNREKKESVPYPWDGLNEKLYGLRQGEIVTLTGGTGLGKSSITREIEHWLLDKTEDGVGIIALEESWERTVDGIISIEGNKRYYIDQVREEDSAEYLNISRDYSTRNKDKLWIYSHFGASDVEEIMSRIRYMIVGCDCKWIIVDHLHMLVSASDESNERMLIDRIMTQLRKIAEQTGAGLILVSHLKRLDGNRGHENGVEVSLSHLRGSGGIAHISDWVIALERNQQSDDPMEAQTTQLRILKSRYTGDVGPASALYYDKDTGRLSEIYKEEEEEL